MIQEFEEHIISEHVCVEIGKDRINSLVRNEVERSGGSLHSSSSKETKGRESRFEPLTVGETGHS
jgi:hypothetical protein